MSISHQRKDRPLLSRVRKVPLTAYVAFTGVLAELGREERFPKGGLLDLNEHTKHPIAGVITSVAVAGACEIADMSRCARYSVTLGSALVLATAVEFGAFGPNTKDPKDIVYTMLGAVAGVTCFKKPDSDETT